MGNLWVMILWFFISIVAFHYFLIYFVGFSFLYELQWLVVRQVIPLLLYAMLIVLFLTVTYRMFNHVFRRLLQDGSFKFLVICMVVGLALRLLHIILVPTQPVSDFKFYDDAAINLLRFRVYGFEHTPTAVFPPGTSLFLAGIYTVFGYNIVYAKITQAILSVLSIALVHRIASTIFADAKVANLATLLLTFMPSHIAFTSVLASENFFTFLNMILLYCLVVPRYHTPFLHFLNGAASGVAALVRPTGLLLPFLPLMGIALRRELKYNRRRIFIYILTCMLGFFLVIGPWGLRNYLVFGHFALGSSSGGIDLWMGNNERATGRWIDMKPTIKSRFSDVVSRGDEFNRDKLYYGEAFKFILENPGMFARLALRKVVILFSGDTECIWWSITGENVITSKELIGKFESLLPLIAAVYDTYFYMILSLALLAVPYMVKRSLGRSWGEIVLLFYVSYFTLIHAVFISGQRFHFNIVPPLTILAAFTLKKALDRDSNNVCHLP